MNEGATLNFTTLVNTTSPVLNTFGDTEVYGGETTVYHNHKGLTQLLEWVVNTQQTLEVTCWDGDSGERVESTYEGGQLVSETVFQPEEEEEE